MGRLDDADLSLSLSRKKEEERLTTAQTRLLQLRLHMGGLLGSGKLGPPVCVVFEGWDASGKGGAIRRLVSRLDPRHVRVKQYAAPSEDELRHHWLTRFWPALPGWGGMAVLDRSWYGRVLVERVEGFASEAEWRRSYDEIVDFEQMLAYEGTVMIKFWLHVSPEVQKKRFEARARDPLKMWKLTDEDWRNRERWDEYSVAIEDMFAHTDRPHARWHVIPADSKRYARVQVVDTVNDLIEAAMRNQGLEVPDALTLE
jgi:polyphosphate kinase 2 (PPK2 family)